MKDRLTGIAYREQVEDIHFTADPTFSARR